MKVFVSGGCKNGKSSMACRLAMQLARGGPLYYVATLIPRDAEDEARIQYHVRRRRGLGFQTIDCGRQIADCRIPKKGATVLLDSVTALVQNECFAEDGAFTPRGSQIARQLLAFSGQVDHIIFISDYIYSDAGHYGELTNAYCQALAQVDRTLARHCDTVVEICAATSTIHKGSLPLFWDSLTAQGPRELIIGGAHQGKLAYATRRYGVSPGDFYHCRDDRPPDLNARFLCGLENYVRYCLRHDIPMQTSFPADTVLLCQDLFCGVVPVDPELRRWRDATGHYLASLSSKAAQVTRVFCGLPQRIK